MKPRFDIHFFTKATCNGQLIGFDIQILSLNRSNGIQYDTSDKGIIWPFTHNWNNRIRFFEKTVIMIRSGKYVINNGCSFVFVNFKYFNGK